MKRLLRFFRPGRLDRVLAVSCAVQCLVILVFAPRGAFSVDEVTQLSMLRWLSHDHSLAKPTLDATSPEIAYAMVHAVGARLVPQYPHGFTFVATPFYLAFGVRGVMVVNTVAYFATASLVAKLARTLFRERSVAIVSTAIFVLATYAWDYSIAIWPHASTVAMTTLAMWLAVRASLETQVPKAQWLALGAGLAIGIGTTFRLDAIFALVPVVLAPLLLAPKLRLKPLAMIALGLAPGLAFLSLTNRLKFGHFAPFSYGERSLGSPTSGIGPYVPLAFAAMVSLAGLVWLVRRKPPIRTSARPLVALALALFAGLVAYGPMRERALDLARGIAMLGLDLRYSDPRVVEPALLRGSTNAMIYVGTVKKSLLQSLPYVPLVLLLVNARTGRRRGVLVLALGVLVPFFAYAAFRWHGGMSFNLRYMLGGLPFLAVLVTATLRRVVRDVPLRLLRHMDVVAVASAAAYLGVFAWLRPAAARDALQERFYLDVPLVIALLTTGLVVVFLVGVHRSRIAAALSIVAIVGFVWAGMTAFTYDAAASMRRRGFTERLGAAANAVVPAGSLLFVDVADSFASTLEVGTELAVFSQDRGRDLGPLSTRAACAGRPVFIAGEPGKGLEDAIRQAVQVGMVVQSVHEDRAVEIHSLHLRELGRCPASPN